MGIIGMVDAMKPIAAMGSIRGIPGIIPLAMPLLPAAVQSRATCPTIPHLKQTRLNPERVAATGGTVAIEGTPVTPTRGGSIVGKGRTPPPGWLLPIGAAAFVSLPLVGKNKQLRRLVYFTIFRQ